MRQTTNYGLKITEGNDDWRNIFDDNAYNMDAIDDAIAPMTGATVSSDGTSGVVPEPESGDQNKFLKGDASWAIPGVMTVNGRSPDASGNITVIEGGGSSSYGSYRLDATIPVSAWTGNGPYVATVSNQYITANMDGTETWLDDETAMLGDTTFTTSNGLLTISTTVKPTAEWSLHVALAVNGADVLADISSIREDVEDNADAIVALRNNISNTLGHGTAISASSLSALKTNLLAIANTADVNGFIAVKIVPSFTSDGFTSGSTYGGHIYNIYKTNGSTTYFSAIVSNNLGEDVLIGYSNGTWYFNSPKKNIDILNSNLSLQKQVMAIVLNANDTAPRNITTGQFVIANDGYMYTANEDISYNQSASGKLTFASGGGLNVLNSNLAVTSNAHVSYNTDVISSGSITLNRIGRLVVVSLDFTTSQVISSNTVLVTGLPESTGPVWLIVTGYNDNKSYRVRVAGSQISTYYSNSLPAQVYNGFVVYVAKTL